MPDLDIVPFKDRCQFCRKKRATKQCDFPTGAGAACGAKACDECAVSLGNEIDLCPKCVEMVVKMQKKL